jgi:hypothetical protein
MLKDQTTEDRLEDFLSEHSEKVGRIAWAGSFVGSLILFCLKHGDVPSAPYFLSMMMFLLFASGIANFLGTLLLIRLVTWMGGMRFREGVRAMAAPTENSGKVDRLLDTWWSSELAIDAFLVLFNLTVCVAAYRFIGPLLDIL